MFTRGPKKVGEVERPEAHSGRGATRTSTRTVRRMRRIGGSRRPFFPYGFVPLVGLTLLFPFAWIPFAYAAIQSEVFAAARTALASVGADWATASVDGQSVHLGGIPPSREAATQAFEAVRLTQAQTLFGKAYPVTHITERFVWPEPAAQPAPAPASPAPALAPTAPVPVDPVPTPAAPVTVAPTPPPPTCDQILAELLEGSKIQFATASAQINPASSALLGEIATAVASCPPGRLRIEGHTDNVGRAQFNAALSQSRAEAVRTALIQRGIPADRLMAFGFGAEKPLADNATEDGRARNRRIEIRMIPPT